MSESVDGVRCTATRQKAKGTEMVTPACCPPLDGAVKGATTSVADVTAASASDICASSAQATGATASAADTRIPVAALASGSVAISAPVSSLSVDVLEIKLDPKLEMPRLVDDPRL